MLTAGIVLIQRNISGASRTLGIVFLIAGATEYAGAFIGKNLIASRLQASMTDVPLPLQEWALQLASRLIAPLATFSLAVLIAGAVLLIVSFVYPRRAGTG